MSDGASGTGDNGKAGDAGQQGASDWRASLPDDLKEAPALKDVTDVGALAKQFVDQQKYLGNAVRIPGEDASEDDKKAFREKLRAKVPNLVEVDHDNYESFEEMAKRFGAPEDPTKYVPPKFEDLPEGMKESPLLDILKNAGVKSKLTQKQFENIAREFTETELQRARTHHEEHKAGMKKLADEWGYAFDKKLEAAVRAAEVSGAPEQLVEAVKGQTVPPEVMKWLAGLADQLGGEGKANDGRKGEGDGFITPQEAQAQHDEIMANREHPYWTARPGSPEKKRAIEKVLALKELAMGRGSKDAAATFGHH